MVDSRPGQGGVEVILDSTAFYPEGGGQPSDTGQFELEGAVYPVTHVTERDGQIVHEVQSLYLVPAGSVVRAKVDWERRFDHMQQHTGQHILSRAFELVLGAKTVGFHLSREYVSIDLDKKIESLEAVYPAEDLANQAVYQDLLVEAVVYPKDAVPPQVRRRIPVPVDEVRVVNIQGFDQCACGGTHVRRTGEVGVIRVNQLDKAHGGTRVFFRCGKRAILDMREKERALMECASVLSRKPLEVPEALADLISQMRDSEKTLKDLKENLLELEAQSLSAKPAFPEDSPWKAVFAVTTGKNADEVKRLASNVASSRNLLVVVLCPQPYMCACVSMPRDPALYTSHGVTARVVLQRLSSEFGLRGGGNDILAQAGSKMPSPLSSKEVLERAKKVYLEFLESL